VKPWKKVRVVVEVPVQGDFTQKDLRWVLEWGCNIHAALNANARFTGSKFGRLRIKLFSNVQGYETRVLKQKVSER
jgi:hypothetical protein